MSNQISLDLLIGSPGGGEGAVAVTIIKLDANLSGR